MALCAVKSCGNKSKKHRELMFHRMPRQPERLQQWISSCGIEPNTPMEKLLNYRVCEEHFPPDDYVEVKFFMRGPTRKLKDTAVPSVFKHQTFCRTWCAMTSLAQTKEAFRVAEAVCFDVDSTVIREEGIDELAKFCGVGDAVTEMTRKAMGGSVTFKTALTERLSIIKCSREQVNKLITDHPPQLTPGIKELVERLHQRNVKVFLISGGFRCIVEHVATQLGIPLDHVYANRLKFYFNGEYAGFDETQPTAESGGKGKVISLLKEKYGFKKIVMIGDGATDLESCPPASAFIGFGGNVVRQQVKEKCSWYVTSFGELLKELEKI